MTHEKTIVNWCKTCRTPIVSIQKSADCPRCQNKTKYLCTDIRPVFPEERLLLELLVDKPMSFYGKAVWASKRRFYVDGNPMQIKNEVYSQTNAEAITQKFRCLQQQNSDEYFKEHTDKFIDANRTHLNVITEEAISFIRSVDSEDGAKFKYISFSGGKDSTVTAHLVHSTLGFDVPCIFGDTTLEFPSTYEYVERFARNHSLQAARNDDRDFFNMCETIGPPSRTMRWCCTMFKTGPVARLVDEQLRRGSALAFLGIRKRESAARSKYERINRGDTGTKIRGQTTASPIFEWSDADVWLYILANDLDFNEAYRRGYARAGCFCCPNNSDRNRFLSLVFMPEQSKRWQELLLRFAIKTKKPNPEEYIHKGYWMARLGGQGLRAAESLKIHRSECTMEEHVQIYKLTRPIDKHLWNLLAPLGRVTTDGGRKLLNEMLVLDYKSGYPILAATPHSADGLSVKIRTFEGVNANDVQRRCGYQIRKFNACQGCLKCEALCRFGAIAVTADGYHIDETKCRHCGICTTAKYLEGGCLMSRYLRVPKEEKEAA